MKYTSPDYVEGTTRRRVVTDDGQVLEKQSVYLPASVWSTLKTLGWKQGRSGSQIIESLILIAALSSESE